MRRELPLVGLVLLLGVMLAGACAQKDAETKTAAASMAPAAVQTVSAERGEYLVTIGGCHDCHTPFKMGEQGPEPDMSRALSGHPEDLVMPPPPALGDGPWVWIGSGTNTAFAGPWGISYARNLTPEELTGIGIWTEEIFINTLRTGRHWGVSRPILPPMPWQNYALATDEDLKSIWAYLRTVKPIKNQTPEAVLAPPPPGAGM
ncbi:MAG TPA: diheme cytochrome c-553 [Thermoanaerobaculia bacterium]